ncbi:MAG: hypothetical protein M9949_11280 [Candidatus Kapabacteria bacterium]|nr:hypothetical protein [Candidatus Kapabacteria bacterium]
MKKIILIAIFLGAFGTLLAQTHNAPVLDNGNLKAKVIRPLLFTDISGGNQNIPFEVIKGQSRLFSPGEMVKLFKMEKEPKIHAQVNIQCDDVVGNVAITAVWYWFDTQPDWSGYLTGTPINPASGWYWIETDPSDPVGTYEGWIGVEITKINAENTNVTVGTKTFTATISGSYIGL